LWVKSLFSTVKVLQRSRGPSICRPKYFAGRAQRETWNNTEAAMISITADQLFLISEIQWQQNLCHIDPKFLTARFVASPGFHVCLPRWCWKQDCERWLSKTGALPIAEFELTDELRERVDDHDLMRREH